MSLHLSVCFNFPHAHHHTASQTTLPLAIAVLQQGKHFTNPFSPICEQSGLTLNCLFSFFVSLPFLCVLQMVKLDKELFKCVKCHSNLFSFLCRSSNWCFFVCLFWWVFVFKLSSSPLFSSMVTCQKCYITVNLCRCSLFEWLQEEYQASLIKTNYWISRVINVHCRLIEVNAASAASEHLSYLKGNGIANGCLMNCVAKQGEFSVPMQTGLGQDYIG